MMVKGWGIYILFEVWCLGLYRIGVGWVAYRNGVYCCANLNGVIDYMFSRWVRNLGLENKLTNLNQLNLNGGDCCARSRGVIAALCCIGIAALTLTGV